jgi:adenylate cyclase class 2
MTEQEIKLPVADLEEARLKLAGTGAIENEPRHFEDNYLLDTSEQTLRKTKTALRVRMVADKGILTFKGQPDTSAGIKSREEIECELTEPDNLLKIFSRLGFAPVFRYQKYRTVYGIQGVPLQICLDETPIGNYFELEGEPEQIHEYARRLGYRPADYVTQSYAALYFEWAAEKKVQPSEMVFR